MAGNLRAVLTRGTIKYRVRSVSVSIDIRLMLAHLEGHGHVLMDQYDLLMEKISLYSHLPPHEIRRRTWELGTRGTFTLVHVINGKVSVTLATWGKHVVCTILS